MERIYSLLREAGNAPVAMTTVIDRTGLDYQSAKVTIAILRTRLRGSGWTIPSARRVGGYCLLPSGKSIGQEMSLDRPLSPQRQRALKLFKMKCNIPEIAEIMGITENHANVVLCALRKRGLIPPSGRRKGALQ